LPVRTISVIMTVMIALAIVLTIRMVGIMLLLSMLSLPPMIAEIFAARFKTIMTSAVAVSAATCAGGIIASAYINVPCSAVIVILQVVVYGLSRVAAGVIARHNKKRLADV
ncbi:MAG: metal ABC transporter permease, partial [Muribaculaceae bacterium]|nr:metal ABC transporter permease [Muribaculaceae bacterium]